MCVLDVIEYHVQCYCISITYSSILITMEDANLISVYSYDDNKCIQFYPILLSSAVLLLFCFVLFYLILFWFISFYTSLIH